MPGVADLKAEQGCLLLPDRDGGSIEISLRWDSSQRGFGLEGMDFYATRSVKLTEQDLDAWSLRQRDDLWSLAYRKR